MMGVLTYTGWALLGAFAIVDTTAHLTKHRYGETVSSSIFHSKPLQIGADIVVAALVLHIGFHAF